MDKTYEKRLRSGIDLSPLGVEPGGEAYFCTPRGASIIGGEGVDGIHYCFVRGYGGAVFAVSPMSGAPDYVQAVAPDFMSFLRLLSACGHSAAIEQCRGMTRGQFAAFLAENPPSDAARELIKTLREKLSVEPMPDPWGFIRGLQNGFDYSGIRPMDPDAMPDPEPAKRRAASLFRRTRGHLAARF